MTERDLIQRLADELAYHSGARLDGSDDALVAEARAYLAQAPAEPVAWRDPAYALAAQLCRMNVVEVNGEDFLRRESVMDFVVQWRAARDKMPKAYVTPPGAAAEIAKLRGALERLRQWNMLDNCADGQWVKNLIDEVTK
jgi:hypothetical protein